MVYSKSPSAQSSKKVPCPATGVKRSATFTAKALAVLVSYPNLISEIKSKEWIKELSRPESILFLQVVEYFQTFPNSQVADLLSSLDVDSASFIGSLLSNNPLLEEKNSVAYFQDCLKALKRTNPIKRIVELKSILGEEKLTEEDPWMAAKFTEAPEATETVSTEVNTNEVKVL